MLFIVSKEGRYLLFHAEFNVGMSMSSGYLLAFGVRKVTDYKGASGTI
ncbi:hypothetical protein SAMN05443144_10517 [Fodinibius roseus]|uniref:Uncharacterized protein n=1 Tax=Fodinibius roseus TaxID=1194090 RepID=A0A1M4YAL1_9BACT|nr:hypothetical protein SAMN05443144_10517 [Fodinibius roseus]